MLNGNQYGMQFIATFKNEEIVLAVLITMGQVGYRNLQKKETNNIILCIRAYVHTTNGSELMESFRNAALLFVHTLLVYCPI